MSNEVSEVEEAVQYAIDFTESPDSRLFFLKAALRLAPGQLREAVDEIRMRENSREFPVHDRARYVIWTLNEWMKEAGVSDDVRRPSAQERSRPLAQRPLESLRAISVPSVSVPATRSMETPFSRRWIPWFREMTNDFFTLTNDRADFDEIVTAFESNGETPVTLIRGKLAPDDRTPMGIPTVEDMRVLIASVKAWSDDSRGTYDEYENSAKTITHILDAHRLCEILGISRGGKQIEDVTNALLKLKRTGYYFKLPNGGGFSFNFIDGCVIVDRPGNRRRHLKITYSEQYSRQLIDRNVVSRPPSLLTVRGDIAFKIIVYLFPILKKKGEHAIELNPLIDLIGLKRTGWSAQNGYKSLRKREFEKAVKEVNERMEGWELSIEQGLNKADFMLVSRLVKST